MLEAMGATVLLCPTNVEADDPRSYYKVAARVRDEQGAYLPNQYYNQANPEAHYRSTGPEIWRQTDGKITHWVAGVGTGGTISGVGRVLREELGEGVQIVAVEPAASAVLSGQAAGMRTAAAALKSCSTRPPPHSSPKMGCRRSNTRSTSALQPPAPKPSA